ncbi:MAG: hypothetical protein ABS81_23240 [Pseudonocardia sp. SCN 72-86]|nr:MAG: hypothetical protein ABS81_23240 [Pseudonocardia sp. SCN 72-86]
MPPPVAAGSAASCNTATHYVNTSGNCVPRPGTTDTGGATATATCKDGTSSYSQHRSGTCSGHGGVAQWLVNLP